MSTLHKNINSAERNAKRRDIEIENQNHIDVDLVNKVEEKAGSLGYGIYKKRDTNKAHFTQIINDNWDMIVRSSYLTGSELTFLMSVQSLIEYQVNAIADRETGQFMTISEIANYIGKERSGVSKTVKALIKKGILFEFVNVDEILEFQRSVSKRTLFVNPELFYAGDKNKIDSTLSMLVNQFDKLEKNKILFEWKVFRKPGDTFGKLYRRRTYLDLKRKCSGR